MSYSSSLRDDALAGRVVLVTGGGTGIGRATAIACARAGATVVVCGRRAGPLDAVAASLASGPGGCLPVVCDVREADQVTELVSAALSAFGRIDVLVHCA